MCRLLALCFALVTTIDAVSFTQSASDDRRGPRTDHAVGFYDPQLGRVVIVGGPGDPKPGDRDAVWSWSGTRWDRVTTPGPPGRVNAGAAYELDRKRGVVVGGSRKTADAASWEVVGDSWAGDANGWQPIEGIAPRDHQSLVEDGRGGVLMFGGIPADRSAPWPADTWRLHDGRWTRVATSGPTGRGRAAMTYDATRQVVVLFGGASGPAVSDQSQTFLADTWIWNGDAWRKAADGGPPGRYAHGMAFDERTGVVLLYSGAAAHTNAPLHDMWQWDGTRWTEIRLAGPTPGYRYQPIMVYDRARAKTVLYGGIGGPSDTWEWDGHKWEQAGP